MLIAKERTYVIDQSGRKELIRAGDRLPYGARPTIASAFEELGSSGGTLLFKDLPSDPAHFNPDVADFGYSWSQDGGWDLANEQPDIQIDAGLRRAGAAVHMFGRIQHPIGADPSAEIVAIPEGEFDPSPLYTQEDGSTSLWLPVFLSRIQAYGNKWGVLNLYKEPGKPTVLSLVNFGNFDDANTPVVAGDRFHLSFDSACYLAAD